jgi:hypothetical protein
MLRRDRVTDAFELSANTSLRVASGNKSASTEWPKTTHLYSLRSRRNRSS